MVIPSVLDRTIAPEGAHVCLLFTQFTPYNCPGGWTEDAKESYASRVNHFINISTFLLMMFLRFPILLKHNVSMLINVFRFLTLLMSMHLASKTASLGRKYFHLRSWKEFLD